MDYNFLSNMGIDKALPDVATVKSGVLKSIKSNLAGWLDLIPYAVSKKMCDWISAFKPEVISERNKKIAIANTVKDEEKKAKALANALSFGFPKFKSKNKCNDSLFYPQNFIIKKSRIFLPKLVCIHYTNFLV